MKSVKAELNNTLETKLSALQTTLLYTKWIQIMLDE